MSQFSKSTFDAAAYLAFRPQYRRGIFDLLFDNHQKAGGAFDLALDLGCGPGLATLPLANRFRHVIGQEPSKSMVDAALKPTDSGASHIEAFAGAEGAGTVEYRIGSAEDLSGFKDSSVDLAIAAQAAHWFDPKRVWTELSRVIKPQGTVAWIGYGELTLPKHPSSKAVTSRIFSSLSSPPSILGPYWEQPGRSYVERRLSTLAVPDPTSPPSHGDAIPQSIIDQWDATQHQRLTWEGGLSQPEEDRGCARKMKWDKLEKYFNTASAVHKYKEEHPNDDIAKRFRKELEEKAREEGAKDEVEVVWPLVMILLRKK